MHWHVQHTAVRVQSGRKNFMNGDSRNADAEGGYPVRVVVEEPERSSRFLAVCALLGFIPKLIVLVPHIVALVVFGFIAGIVVILAQFVILFTGKYPKELFRIAKGFIEWRVRVLSYLFGLTDIYPPFRL